jgi:hypothetical protein
MLPRDAAGKPALLLLGFTHDSHKQVESWVHSFRERFGNDGAVTFFEIPMIGSGGRMAKVFIEGGMRHDTPKADYEHVITVFSGDRSLETTSRLQRR